MRKLLCVVVLLVVAFAAIKKSGIDRAESLAAGIGVALYTTIFGLIVAIPSTLLAAHLQAQVRRLLLAMDQALAPVVQHLAAPTPGRCDTGKAPAEDDTHAA